jgi:hypothetical protein
MTKAEFAGVYSQLFTDDAPERIDEVGVGGPWTGVFVGFGGVWTGMPGCGGEEEQFSAA